MKKKKLISWLSGPVFKHSTTSKIYIYIYINVPGLIGQPNIAISCHGIIVMTHMKALGMMIEEFSLPFPPHHQPY